MYDTALTMIRVMIMITTINTKTDDEHMLLKASLFTAVEFHRNYSSAISILTRVCIKGTHFVEFR